MAAAVDDVHFAVVVHVVADDRESGFAQVPFAMPFPFVVVGVDVLEPAVRCEHVHFTVAVNVSHADAVAILIVAPDVMDFWFRPGEIDPNHTRAPVVSQREIRLAVAIDVSHPAALGLDRVRDQMLLPELRRASWGSRTTTARRSSNRP